MDAVGRYDGRTLEEGHVSGYGDGTCRGPVGAAELAEGMRHLMRLEVIISVACGKM